MNDPNSPQNPNPPRATLKLKGGPRKPVKEAAPPPPPAPPRKSSASQDAHWSDEYKRRMQEDMDKLVR
jgi:hypothetical protein